MLIGTRKYLVQFIKASDGTRDEPFIITPSELQEQIIKLDESIRKDFYVLLLADTTLDIKPQEFVSKFPLFTLQSWTNLTFNNEDLTHES